jgi:hypothetical protein
VSTGQGLVRWLAAGAGTAAGLAVLAWSSSVFVPFHSQESAQLRLSWSARPERIETCRTLTAEELSQREEHMRQRVDCVGASATYALRVEVDDQLVAESVVRGAGLRHDRPLYLLREFEVPPGAHRVRLTFTRREKTDDDAAAYAPVTSSEPDTGLFAGRGEREAAEHARRARAAIPSRLALDTILSLGPRSVALVTFDPERRALQLQTGNTRP